MKKNALAALYEKDGTKKVLSSLISILAGLLVGGIAVLIVGLCNEKISLTGAWDGIRIIFAGIFSTGRDAAGTLTWGFNAVNLGNMLFRATPLIMTGLSVAVAFKTGLFNIGAPGQYLISTMVTLMVALSIPSESVPVGIIWLLAFLGGMLAGALWGAIPGLLKATLNINEVIACIMTNWIAANLVTWMFDISSFKNVTEGTKSGYIYKTTFNGVATPKLGLDQLFPGSQVNAGILVAIILAIVVYIIMEKTVFGYELKATGFNFNAAKYCGMKENQNIILTMVIAGALAGFGAGLLYLTGIEDWETTISSVPAMGFNGIAVAFLGGLSPIGSILSAFFIQYITTGGGNVDLQVYCSQISSLISALIIYLCAFVGFFKYFIQTRLRKADERKAAKAAQIQEGGEDK